MSLNIKAESIVICALYKFITLENYQALREPLLRFMEAKHIKGSLLLANEGINGTVSGTRESIDNLIDFLQQDLKLGAIEYKESYEAKQPFTRTKVKLKKEIVTMGVADIDPNKVTGTYLNSEEWNKLISDPDVIVVDTRNDYEVAVGTFERAMNPNTTCFREFPQYVQENLSEHKNKKVAMFCTGGIRCEKSTAYLKQQGFNEVYHLKGGILKYLEEIPEDKSLWNGECYVFDQRVTVGHDLQKGSYDQCNACRMPITAEDKLTEDYVAGISCPHCATKTTEQQKYRFSEREKQIEIAKKYGISHIGSEVKAAVKQRRSAKAFAKEQSRKSQQSRTTS
jgi:UPF0176 protein